LLKALVAPEPPGVITRAGATGATGVNPIGTNPDGQVLQTAGELKFTSHLGSGDPAGTGQPVAGLKPVLTVRTVCGQHCAKDDWLFSKTSIRNANKTIFCAP